MFRLRKGVQEHDDQPAQPARDVPAPPLDMAPGVMARRQPPQLPSRPLTSAAYTPEYGRRPADSRSTGDRSDVAISSARDRCLMVGRDVQLKGTVSACDQMSVDGYAEITLNEARLLRIGSEGHFKGQVDVAEADIAGRFEGDLIVRAKLTVRATARITGVIRYGNIVVEAGGQLAGEISGLSEEKAPDVSTLPVQIASDDSADPSDRRLLPTRGGQTVPYQLASQGVPAPSKS